MIRRFLAIAAIAALSACGGGAHSLLPGSGSKTQGNGMLKVSFTLPAGTASAIRRAQLRGRKYISYGANGVTLVAASSPSTPTVPASGAAINGGGTNGVSYDISEATGTGVGKNCTTSGTAPQRTCTLSVPAPPGNYNVIMTFWDAVPADSQHAPTGNVLSQSPSVNVVVAAAQSASLNFTFDPYVHDVLLNLDKSVLAYNTVAETANLSVVLKDIDGNIIVDDGTGNALEDTTGAALTVKITAADTDPNTLALCPGAAAAAATTIGGAANVSFSTTPTAAYTVQYQGGCLISDTLSSSATAGTIAGTSGTAALNISGISQQYADGGSMTKSTLAMLDSTGAIEVFGEDGSSNGYVESVTASSGAASGTTALTNGPAQGAMLASDGDVWITEDACTAPGQCIQPIVPGSPPTLGTACTLTNNGSVQLHGLTQDGANNFWVVDGGLNSLITTPAGSCSPSSYTLALGSPAAPTLGSTVDASGVGCTQTCYVEVTYVDAAGETLASGESTLSVAAGNDLTVTLNGTPPVGATAWNVYAADSNASGNEALQSGGTPSGTNIPIGTTTWTEATTGFSGAGSPPGSDTSGGSGNADIAFVSPDLWITQNGSSTIAVVSTGGVIQHEYATATAASGPGALAVVDATHLAYLEATVNKIAVVDTTTGASTDYALNGAYAIDDAYERVVVGADGNLYFAENNAGAGAIGQFNPTSHAIVDYPAGLGAGDLRGLATDVDGGNIWAAQFASTNVARFWLP